MGRMSSQKRQKEMKRREKRQMKDEKRAQRKIEKTKENETADQVPDDRPQTGINSDVSCSA